MKVSVTEHDIDMGGVGSERFCPIARALKRALGRSVRVAEDHWRFEDDDGSGEIHPLPRRATTFIRNFDELFPVKPFEFDT